MTSRIRWIVLALLALTLEVSSPSAATLPTDFVEDEILGGFSEPTSLAFLPDGRILITEQRTGRVEMVVNGHTDSVGTVANLNASGNERGLLAIAIHPAWPDSPYVFLYHNRIGSRLRLVRYKASGDLNDPAGENLTIAEPLFLLDDIPDAAFNHNGGSLRFGLDGHLYLSIGEDADRCAAQDSTRMKGVLLRLDVSRLPPGPGGQVLRSTITPVDNPLSTADSNAKLVFAYGLRNPFRFQVDSETGNLYVADVGDQALEEMDEVLAGDNLGWPFREGTAIRIPGTCVEPPGFGPKGPIAIYSHNLGQSIIAMCRYRPRPNVQTNWPADTWGDVFFCDYFGGFVRRRKQNTDGQWLKAMSPGQPDTTNWAIGLEQPVDFQIGPDGNLWWLSQFDPTFGPNTGTLRRFRYTGPPVGVVNPVRASGLSGAPTPFTTSTELSFAIASAGAVRLAIYDVAGREVRRLMDGPAAAGTVRIAWDGKDHSGRSVPAGVYLARLDRTGGSEVVRLLRLR